ISVSAVRRASSCFSGHRAAVASRCLAHHSSDMLYRPELAQDASKGATTRNAGSEPRNDAARTFLYFFIASPLLFSGYQLRVITSCTQNETLITDQRGRHRFW